ncbi:hypothetical protein [Flavobacterium sp. KJJ]|uniref:hypothetical protein n=1 Tax=Flavobacterium sp. KJJ TaxID=1270193 RepID=UPI0004938AD9|nr:hypothetical protein [Flavobacterium sp. KJJ]
MLKKLEDLIKFFPLIFILLTTLGYIHLQSYYYFFDIEIINYLDVSEIVLLFFDKSILLIAGILIIIPISYILDNKLSQSNNQETIQRPETKINSDKYLKRMGYFIVFIMIVRLALNVISGNYISLVFTIGFIICLFIFFLLEKYLFKILIQKFSVFFFLSLFASFAMLLLASLLTISNIVEKGYNIRYNNEIIKEVSFSYNNKIIQTSKELIYIGETKKNIFLFNPKKNETMIFKMENIDNFRIKIK